MRVFRCIFPKQLQFRKGAASQHAECTICWGLKKDIASARTLRDREVLVQRYVAHIWSQWSDRQIWWSLCTLSVSWFEAQKLARGFIASSMCCLIIDGMDQAKFRVPRISTSMRLPKELAKLRRPACHLVGTWVQGAVLQFSVSDENVLKNSETQCECIARALQEMYARVGSLPLGLHIQADNCCREGKMHRCSASHQD